MHRAWRRDLGPSVYILHKVDIIHKRPIREALEPGDCSFIAILIGAVESYRHLRRPDTRDGANGRTAALGAAWNHANGMNGFCCGSTAEGHGTRLTSRPMSALRRQFNERSAGMVNRACLPSDIIALVVVCRPRYRLTLLGIEASHDAVRDWEAKLLPVMGDRLRKRRRGRRWRKLRPGRRCRSCR
jgi:hypothetical protein